MITLTTEGESHGKGLFAIIEGIPKGLRLDLEGINAELFRRQGGYGRGARQKIERDEAEILSGVRNLETLGSPLTLAVWNRDYENWKEVMAPEGCDISLRRVENARPGHADLAGMIKFGQTRFRTGDGGAGRGRRRFKAASLPSRDRSDGLRACGRRVCRRE